VPDRHGRPKSVSSSYYRTIPRRGFRYADRVVTRLRHERIIGFALSGVTYLAAFGVAYAVVRLAGPLHPLAETAVGTLTATILVFLVSMAADNSSMYDPYWSLQPLGLAVYYLWTHHGGFDARQILVAVLVFLYSARLTSNFFRDWPGLSKEDFRYVAFRRRFGKFYWLVSFWGVHLFPTVLVYLGCLPLYAVAQTDGAPFGWLDGLGTVVVLGAVILAFVADEQLRRFRRDPANGGRHMNGGLWAYSRHPNYLGEIAFWWGLWLFALACEPAWWWSGVGAAAITLMFVFVSVPLMERRAAATRPGYGGYRDSTPMLLPRLPARRRARELG